MYRKTGRMQVMLVGSQPKHMLNGQLPVVICRPKPNGKRLPEGANDDRRYPSGNISEDPLVSPFGVRLCHLLEWTQDAYDRLAYRHNPVVFDPRMESAAGAGDEARRVVRGRNPESKLANYTLAERLGMEPIIGAFSTPVGFRVAVDLEHQPQS
ncbi:MAG: hypothetical protein KatS3mg105_0588 [Gemmatales bacterium]|nr:MAG: hypothetical protein KatS3mg105_0588 [Gemmatales bacterium]